MERDVDRDAREAGVGAAVPERLPAPREARDRPLASREHTLLRERGYAYRLRPAELETMHDIGRFRTVAMEDLARHRYDGEPGRMQQDLRSLRAQGLVQWRTVWTGPRSQ